VGECLFWYRPTRVVPDQRAVKRLCVCVATLDYCALYKYSWLLSLRCSLINANNFCVLCSTAVSMSEVLHYLCQLDAMSRPVPSASTQSTHAHQRVSPLVFVIRQWARSVGVTSTLPGVGFSNFMLTLLVVFFLQTRRSPLLPPLGSLKSMSSGPTSFLQSSLLS